MPVITREYFISQSTPEQIINVLNTALIDLGYISTSSTDVMGYLTTFTNTAGVTRVNRANERYLVTQSATTGTGSGAVFDVLRNQLGAISTVTVVTGGSGYELVARSNVTSSGTTLTVTDTTGIVPGMVVSKVTGGTGTFATNTIVTSVTAPFTVVVNQTPTVGLSAANVTFGDTITIPSSAISGSTDVTQICTGSAASASILVTNPATIFPGQVVSGSGIFPLTTVSSIQGTTVTLSRNPSGSFSGSLTFSDDIICTVTGVVNEDNIPGTITAGSATITNVPHNTMIYVGAEVEITSGSASMYPEDGRVFISTITGTGPYTLTLRNQANTFKGFNVTGTQTIRFKASRGNKHGWFAYDTFSTPLTAAWSVAKVNNAANKRLGNTFWCFYVVPTTATHQPLGGVTPILYVRGMTGFNPNANTAQGVSVYDFTYNAAPAQTSAFSVAITGSSNVMVPLTVRTRQSEVDPNFAVISFLEGNNTRNNFFISRYNTSYQPWDLNDVYLGGVYELFASPAFATLDAGINFRTRMTGLPKRMAEAGFGNYFLTTATTIAYTNTFYRTSSGNRQSINPTQVYDDIMFYIRQTGDIQTNISSVPVFKNIPINPAFAPVPYYLPSDFVLAEIPFGNGVIGDKLVVTPGVEEYTIIQFATNQTTYTSLVLAARTV